MCSSDLTHSKGGGASADKQFRELAMTALSSVSIQYQCSHVFDIEALKAALRQNGRRPARNRRLKAL